MKAFGLARLGRDAELRRTTQGEAVANLALAFSYGRKGEDGKRPTQWVEASLWGKRAESLMPYLKVGQQVEVLLDDMHIETYEGRNGPGHKLAARVVDVELCGGPGAREPAAASASRAPAPAPAPRQQGGSGFDDMSDDIPF